MLLAAEPGAAVPDAVAAAFRAAAVALFCACFVVTSWHCRADMQMHRMQHCITAGPTCCRHVWIEQCRGDNTS